MHMKNARVLLAGLLALSLLAALPSFAKEKDTTPGRLLTGKVLDKQDNPLPNAVVYVTDTRTRAVKTYIVGADGTYRFSFPARFQVINSPIVEPVPEDGCL